VNPAMATEFQSLVDRAKSLLGAGRHEEALELARKAEGFEHGDDDLETLGAWNNLGTVFFEIGYSEAAERAYKVAESGETRTQSTGLQATLHNNLGQVYIRLGRIREAHTELARAVAIREEDQKDARELAVALDNLGSVEQALGNLDEAETLHERALDIFTRSAGHLSTDAGTAIGNLGALHAARGRFEQAEACRLRALYTHLSASGPLGSETLQDAQALCSLYLRLGRAAEADWLVELMLSVGGREAKPSYRGLAEMLVALARDAFKHHRLDLTERVITRAIELLEATEGREAPATLAARFQRATSRRALGQLDDAENELTELVQRFGNRDDERNTLQTSIELAKTYRDKGGSQPARQLLENAVARLRAKEVGDREMLSSALGNLGELAHHENRNDEARSHYRAALEALDDPSRLDWPWLVHGLATVEYHLGNYEEAARLYTDAKSRWTELHGARHPFVATCAANLALVHWSSGAAADALPAFREAIELRDEDVRRQLVLGSERQRLEYARVQQDDLSKVVSFCIAHSSREPALRVFGAEVTIRRKARVLDGISQTLRLARGSASDATGELLDRLGAVRSEIAQLGSPFRLGPEATAVGELRRLRTEEDALEIRLSHEGALKAPELEKVTLEAIQRALPETAVLIEYVRYKKFDPVRDGRAPWRELRYAAVAIENRGPPAWYDLGDCEEVDSRVNRLRSLIAVPAPLEAIRSEARHLIGLLIAPLSEMIGDRSHWLVAPDGLITLAPFDVLLDAWRGLDDAPLVSFLVTARELAPRPDAPERTGVTILAAPDFDAVAADPDGPHAGAIRRGESFEPLSGAAEEARGVKRSYPEARVIEGGEATVRALTEVDAPLVLHIATHGVFAPLAGPTTTWSTDLVSMPDSLLFVNRPIQETPDPMVHSGLVFAGANTESESGVPGIVTAREIASIDLRGTELVTLSACETGVGHIRDGEEFSGLRRAFGIAGARSQLTSLWAVDDEATAALMIAFYERVRNGKGRARALREAQQVVRRSTGHPEWAHPEYWAAFQLSGDWGPIPVPSSP